MRRWPLRMALLPVVLVAVTGLGCGARVKVTCDKDVVGVNRDAMVRAESTSKEDTRFFWNTSDKSILKIGGSGGAGVAVWGRAPGTVEVTAEGSVSGAVGRITLTVIPTEELPEEIAARTPEGIFVKAAATGDLETVRRLLSEGVDIDYQEEHTGDMSALMAASRTNQVAVVKFLLEAGADPDLQDVNGSTALVAATYQGNMANIKALLAHEADPNLLRTGGRSVLDAAVEGHGRQAFTMLVEGGARKAKLEPAKQLLKQTKKRLYGGRRKRLFALAWLVVFVAVSWPIRLYRIRARFHDYYKAADDDETAYFEVRRTSGAVIRKLVVSEEEPPVCTRVRGHVVFESPASAWPASPLEFHELWHAPFTAYHRWVHYLRLCALSVVCVPLPIVWLIIADNRDSRFAIFELVPSDGVFLTALAAVGVPPILALVALVAFIRLQFAKPSGRQQLVSIIAGIVVLVGLGWLAFLFMQAAVSLGG